MHKRNISGGLICIVTGCVIVMTLWLPVTVLIVVEALALILFGLLQLRK